MSMQTSRLFDPSHFRLDPRLVYACAGGETPFLRAHDAAFSAYANDKARGYAGRLSMAQRITAARTKLAGMWHAPVDQIGFAASVAEGMSMLAESLDLGPGDSVVMEEQEYPSVVLPLLVLSRRRGFSVRFAPDEQAIDTVADSSTRLIGASRVSYLNGKKADLSALRATADRVGAVLAVDFTQAAGYMPIAVDECDFAFSACYKWLLGTTGVAVAFWNRQRQPDWQPTTAGWYSVDETTIFGRPSYTEGVELKNNAMCFSRGNPAHLPIYILDSALDYLGHFDPQMINTHVQTLTAAMLERLHARGLPVITPSDVSRHGASVAFDTPESDRLTHALADRGVLVWGGRDRVRFSFHGYNELSEIDTIDAALGDVL